MKKKDPIFLKNNILNSAKRLLRYYDIGYVLNNIEDLPILPAPIMLAGESKKKYLQNKKIYNQTFSRALKTSEDFEAELKLREDVFTYLRTINPSFCQNMSEKMSAEHDIYLQHLRKLSKAISKISSSLQEAEKGDYNELLLYKNDIMSTIIDSPTNNELANIEDKFVLSELEVISFEEITEPEMIKNISKLKEELNERILKHTLYNKLMSKQNRISLKLGEKVIPEDER